MVVGSLITEFEQRWPDVRDCVTQDMFHDDKCRDIFKRIEDLSEQGAPVDITTVWDMGGNDVEDGLLLMRITNEDFTISSWQYDIECRANNKPKKAVTFADYVTQLIRNHDKRQQEK